jgi:hypothetical protein
MLGISGERVTLRAGLDAQLANFKDNLAKFLQLEL